MGYKNCAEKINGKKKKKNLNYVLKINDIACIPHDIHTRNSVLDKQYCSMNMKVNYYILYAGFTGTENGIGIASCIPKCDPRVQYMIDMWLSDGSVLEQRSDIFSDVL